MISNISSFSNVSEAERRTVDGGGFRVGGVPSGDGSGDSQADNTRGLATASAALGGAAAVSPPPANKIFGVASAVAAAGAANAE